MYRRFKLGLLIVTCGLVVLAGSVNIPAFCQENENIVRIGTPHVVPLLDPLKSSSAGAIQVCSYLFNTLLTYNEEDEGIPCLAEALPERISDRSYVFTLKKGIKFHNGVELKASDVKFTVDKIFDREYGSPWIRVYGWIDSTEVLDEYRIKFNLKLPMVPAIFHQKIAVLRIVSEKAVRELGEKVARYPIGTGPFKFVEWIEGSYITLEKNEDYFMGVPKIDKVIFSAVEEDSVRVINLIGGKFDVVTEVPYQLIPVLDASPDIEVEKRRTTVLTMFRFNCTKAPFDDKRVRQAVSYAIDQEMIAKKVHGGYAIPAECLLPSWHKDYNPNVAKYRQNIEKAKQLLKEAGYPEGFEFELLLTNLPYLVRTGTMVQYMLEQVGIKAHIRLGEQEALFGGYIIPDNFDAVLHWTCLTNTVGRDTDVILRWQLYNGGWQNWHGPAYEEFEHLIDKALTVEDETERRAMYHRIAEIEVEESSLLILLYQNVVCAHNKRLKGGLYCPGGGYMADVTNAYWAND